MSKKKRKRPQPQVKVVSPTDTQDAVFAAQLEKAQRGNLQTALGWGEKLLPLRGVKLGLTFGYDIQQYINMLTLQEMQPQGESNGETTTDSTG
jgi:hypothetical protein